MRVMSDLYVSRLVERAGGGEVVIDEAMAALLADDDALSAVSIGDHDLKGFGLVPLYRLQRDVSRTAEATR